MVTEAWRPELADLDLRSTADLVALMHAEDTGVPAAIGRALGAITGAIDGIAERMGAGGRLIYVGAGTAGRLGVLDASECPPTFGVPPGVVIGLIAGGPPAVTGAVEDAEDDEQAAVADLDSIGLGELDAVVAVSASGSTPYAVSAARYARSCGALTVGLACNPDSALSREVEHPIEAVVGPELLSGSTRLKAGTAQKLVLNMISTITMVRLGKTYGNLMVDMRAVNAKLRIRAARIVAQAAGVALPVAAEALDAADGHVKVAILHLVRDIDPIAAQGILTGCGGNLRAALNLGAAPA
jgi:N-acetylmuramic acid 6-phosphate etherase